MQATIASSVLAIAATIACPGGCLSKPCSANVVPAVHLTITDPSGEVVAPAAIELENEDDSNGPITASCGAQGGSCTNYPVGDSAGTYTITITAPDRAGAPTGPVGCLAPGHDPDGRNYRIRLTS